MEAYKIYREGKTEDEYSNELESICEQLGIPNTDHTHAEYAWKAIITVSHFAGCRVITSITQGRSFPARDSGELRGHIYAYFETPSSQFSGNGFTLQDYDANSVAMREWRRGKISREDIEKYARELFAQWWDSAVQKVLVSSNDHFDEEVDSDTLASFEFANFEEG